MVRLTVYRKVLLMELYLDCWKEILSDNTMDNLTEKLMEILMVKMRVDL